MDNYADALIAFWKGKNGTKGTKDMIAKAKACGLIIRIVKI